MEDRSVLPEVCIEKNKVHLVFSAAASCDLQNIRETFYLRLRGQLSVLSLLTQMRLAV